MRPPLKRSDQHPCCWFFFVMAHRLEYAPQSPRKFSGKQCCCLYWSSWWRPSRIQNNNPTTTVGSLPSLGLLLLVAESAPPRRLFLLLRLLGASRPDEPPDVGPCCSCCGRVRVTAPCCCSWRVVTPCLPCSTILLLLARRLAPAEVSPVVLVTPLGGSDLAASGSCSSWPRILHRACHYLKKPYISLCCGCRFLACLRRGVAVLPGMGPYGAGGVWDGNNWCKSSLRDTKNARRGGLDGRLDHGRVAWAALIRCGCGRSSCAECRGAGGAPRGTCG